MEIKSYADAVYHVKRGFLIIGLTGRTGVGCSTSARILTHKEKPEMPGYEAISRSQPDGQGQRIYQKLKRSWQRLPWNPFVPIEVSKIIFALAVDRAIRSTRRKDETLELIRAIVKGNQKELAALKYLRPKRDLNKDRASELINAYRICRNLYGRFKTKTERDLGDFIELMQDLGDEVRKYGQVSPNKKNPAPENLFVLPEAIRRVIKAYRLAEGASHFVIDAFRNPYEVEYFKRRYSEFYLFGILRDQKERHTALRSLSEKSLEKLERREGGMAVERRKDNIAEWVTSQNLEECLQKADVFVENVWDTTKTYPKLRFNLIKLITLANIPGCMPPTTDERSMQIAMTARQMSGCISRQVGAVVVNKDGYAVGIGWNDPPQGQVSCSLRMGKELVDNPSEEIFSDFERSEEFVQHIRQNYYIERPFCFRSQLPIVLEKPSEDMPEYTRALHAEENALFQAARQNGNALLGATLYTTASTCTLCAKKAYQLGIGRIVFIEEYPGVAIEQTVKAGKRKVEVCRYEGVTGAAYFQLFTTLMPEKDLIQLYL